MPIVLLAAWLGRDHVFVVQAEFFSKAAVVTFGGAYAVLAYMAQQAVEVYGWLEPGEMLNGLAMALMLRDQPCQRRGHLRPDPAGETDGEVHRAQAHEVVATAMLPQHGMPGLNEAAEAGGMRTVRVNLKYRVRQRPVSRRSVRGRPVDRVR